MSLSNESTVEEKLLKVKWRLKITRERSILLRPFCNLRDTHHDASRPSGGQQNFHNG
jgi:hypothetical protein